MSRSSWRIKGKRSGLEHQVGLLLTAAGFQQGYEESTLTYCIPASNHRYIPDFRPTETLHVFLETKGYWPASDRKKMKLVVDQHPEKIFLMVFGNALNTITKRSKTTYGEWCTKHNIRWIDFKTFKQDVKLCRSDLTALLKSGKSTKLPPKKLLKS